MGAVTPQAIVVVSSLALVASALALVAGAWRGVARAARGAAVAARVVPGARAAAAPAAARRPAPAARSGLVRRLAPREHGRGRRAGRRGPPRLDRPRHDTRRTRAHGGPRPAGGAGRARAFAAADGDPRLGRRRRLGVPALRLRDLGAGPLRGAALRDDRRAHDRPLRPVREQEPLRRLDRDGRAAHGRARARPRRRGAPPRPRLDDRRPRGRRDPGGGGVAFDGSRGARVPVAGRHAGPRRRRLLPARAAPRRAPAGAGRSWRRSCRRSCWAGSWWGSCRRRPTSACAA